MIELQKNEEEIESFFELLGDKENDLTFSLAWIFQQSEKLFSRVISKAIGSFEFDDVKINLQKYDKEDGGYTDIEIVIDNKWFIIIEAKKGWIIPSKGQIKKYISRRKEYPDFKSSFIVLTDCSDEYITQEISKYDLNTSIIPISWDWIHSQIENVSRKSNNFQKKILQEFENYLEKVIIMDNIESNLVFCVSLSKDLIEGTKLSFSDIVNKKNKYFYPVGKRWPSPPPNYIAFRMDGKLLSIHYVEDYEIVTNFSKRIPEMKKIKWEPHYLLELDKGFKPAIEIKNGAKWRSNHVWFMLDTIFISSTIKKAVDMTNNRYD